jgi:hypothetical protein
VWVKKIPTEIFGVKTLRGDEINKTIGLHKNDTPHFFWTYKTSVGQKNSPRNF